MLKNVSSGQILCEKTRFCSSFFEKFKGLMFESRDNFDYALVFDLGYETRIGASVHMLFVFFPIDIIFLDENKVVVDIVEGLTPFSLNYTPSVSSRFFVECKTGIGKKVSLGNKLAW